MTDPIHSNRKVRVMLWAPPQSVSTAFQKCMSYVDDIQIINEPYHSASADNLDTVLLSQEDPNTDAVLPSQDGSNCTDAGDYRSMENPLGAFISDAQRTKLDEDLDRAFRGVGWDSKECTPSWVKILLEGDFPGKKVVFAKDLICGIQDQYHLIPNRYRHTFLIRNPTKLVLSQRKVAEKLFPLPKTEFSLAKIPFAFRNWYKQMTDFIDYLKDNNIESDPIIVDADEVQDFPESVVCQYCSTLGIPYGDNLLQWPAGDACVRTNWLISKTALQGNKVFGFYNVALESTKFNPSKPVPPKVEIPSDVFEVVDREEPYYRKLYERRIKP